MLAFLRPKTEPPLDLAMRKIAEADASLTVRRDAWSDMWEAGLSVSRKDGARQFGSQSSFAIQSGERIAALIRSPSKSPFGCGQMSEAHF